MYLLIYFVLLLLLSSSFSASSSWVRLPLLAGEVCCLFLAGFFPHGGDIACMCEGCGGRVFVVCHWPNWGWESTHRLHLYPLGGVFYSPENRIPGRRDLDFTSLLKDSREPWDRFSVSRLDSLAGVVTRIGHSTRATHPSTGLAGWPLNSLRPSDTYMRR